MNWIDEYRKRVLIVKGLSLGMIVVCVAVSLALIFGVGASNSITVVWNIVASIIATASFILFIGTRLVWRRYKGYYICFYMSPIRNSLIVQNQIQFVGGITQFNYYGELPDGTQVMVKIGFLGNVKFAIGNFNHFNAELF